MRIGWRCWSQVYEGIARRSRRTMSGRGRWRTQQLKRVDAGVCHTALEAAETRRFVAGAAIMVVREATSGLGVGAPAACRTSADPCLSIFAFCRTTAGLRVCHVARATKR